MTVAELIEELKQYSPDMLVFARGYDGEADRIAKPEEIDKYVYSPDFKTREYKRVLFIEA